MDLDTLLGHIWSTEPMSFSDLCSALRAEGELPEKGDKAGWRELFRLLDGAASDGLLEIDKVAGRFESVQLTDEGADRVRGQLDSGRGLIGYAEGSR